MRLRSQENDQSSAYTRILQPSFDHEIGPLEREITQCCREVKDEAALASTQAQKQESDLQAQERAEAGEHRISLVKWICKTDTEEKSRRLAIDLRRLKKWKLQALESLSTYDHWRTYKQHRKEWIPGTSEWILENSEFKSWKEGTPKGFWSSGKGKQVKTKISPSTLMVHSSGVRKVSHKVCRIAILHIEINSDYC